ncbi:hypothetical protein LG197_22330 [Pseudomonas asiatica]|uniref:Uncharacterized protein n=1 Tax=Pseudomonas monteilii TaxID=76759 RepID=A0A2N1IN22_9PSED|nr:MULTISPECIES: hypothetical protein [Pseudomonas]PKI19659.1 hypothetical protein CXB65_21635 [Pseudomonas monteilii]RPD93827.1 hypothetical protein EGN69_13205 [Pseudomonas monteilii]WDM87333.1 hypothetical protein LG197_22330 [Pseudomonas asiatica]
MIVKAEIALIQMIQHKEIFFDLIDAMDQVDEGDEIRTVMYQHKLRRLLDDVAPIPQAQSAREIPAERRRLEAALCVENLQRTGLISQVDNARGVLVFAPFVIEMFRHFDSSRLRHLSSADYEVIRKTLDDLFCAFVRLPSLSINDITFKEHVVTLRREIRTATSKMKECVASLQGCLQRLSEIVENADYAEISEASRAQEALAEINVIYMRNILPALQFLDEEPEIKGGVSALSALIRVGELLEGHGHAKLVTSIYYAVESIRSYRHDISVISASLMRYVQQSEAHRMAYDRIERAWHRLYSVVKENQDGSLKDNLIPTSHAVLARIDTFAGLKVRYFEAKVQWPESNPRLTLKEHLRAALPKIRRPAEVHTLSNSQNDDLGKEKRERDIRLLAIGELAGNWPASATQDVHLALHNYLRTRVDEYELADLLVSLEWLKKREDLMIKPMFKMSILENGSQRLRYYNLQLEPVDNV